MKLLILYGSITGTTMEAATQLQQRLQTLLPDYATGLLNVLDASVEQIMPYDIVIFGTSTWDNNSNPDTENFLIRMNDDAPDFKGKPVALFGCGDTSYPDFCGALPLVAEEFKKRGASVDGEFFTIDGFPTDEISDALAQWAKTFVEKHQLQPAAY